MLGSLLYPAGVPPCPHDALCARQPQEDVLSVTPAPGRRSTACSRRWPCWSHRRTSTGRRLQRVADGSGPVRPPFRVGEPRGWGRVDVLGGPCVAPRRRGPWPWRPSGAGPGRCARGSWPRRAAGRARAGPSSTAAPSGEGLRGSGRWRWPAGWRPRNRTSRRTGPPSSSGGSWDRGRCWRAAVPRAVAAWAAGRECRRGRGPRIGAARDGRGGRGEPSSGCGGTGALARGGRGGCRTDVWLRGRSGRAAGRGAGGAPGWRTTRTSTMASPMARRQPKGSHPGGGGGAGFRGARLPVPSRGIGTAAASPESRAGLRSGAAPVSPLTLSALVNGPSRSGPVRAGSIWRHQIGELGVASM